MFIIKYYYKINNNKNKPDTNATPCSILLYNSKVCSEGS